MKLLSLIITLTGLAAWLGSSLAPQNTRPEGAVTAQSNVRKPHGQVQNAKAHMGGRAARGSNELVLTVDVPREVKQGQAVPVRITFTNKSRKMLNLLTPDDADQLHKLVTLKARDSKGEEYQTWPTPNGIPHYWLMRLRLLPGTSWSFTIADLNTALGPLSPGRFRVWAEYEEPALDAKQLKTRFRVWTTYEMPWRDAKYPKRIREMAPGVAGSVDWFGQVLSQPVRLRVRSR